MSEEVQVDPVLPEAAVESQDFREQGNKGGSSSSAVIVTAVDSGSPPRASINSTSSESVSKPDPFRASAKAESAAKPDLTSINSTTSESVSIPDLIRASAKVESLAKPDLTISWEHLTVHVEATGCQCRVSPFDFYAQEYLGVAVDSRNAVNALEDVSGHLKTGEMVLVLSSEQACASALLRTLSGRTVDDVQGTMSLNGISLTQDVWQSWRRVAPYVSADDNSHAPVLTVRETLLFAAQCTNDGTASMEQLNERINRLLKALDLAHVADTVVGNEDLRGISGGQKRRVTVGEMLTSRHVSLLALENITDGLASTDSYSLLSLLKAACASIKVAAIISLLQPSDDMVALFDKILVLNPHGEMTYFGRVDRALLRQVFLGEGENDEGSICDLVLALKDDFQQDAVLKRYHGSTVHQEMVVELDDIRAEAPPARNRDIRVFLPDTKYASHWWYQFQIIGARRLKLIARNAVTYTRIGIAVVFGVIIGSLFSELKNDLIGSLSRSGYMFLNCFLVLMLSAAITIPQTFRERITLFKHRSAEFYSGRVAYVTQVLLDIPLSVLEAVLLSFLSYFWVGMREGGNHFMFFLGTLIGLEFVGQAFGRLLCALSRKQVHANSLSSVFILVFGTVASFMPGYDDIPPILRWLSWITPAAYAFEGIMINEFEGRNISAVVLPNTDGSVDTGNIQGADWINNFGLPRQAHASTQGIKIFDLLMLFVMSVVFDVLGCYFVENTRDWYFNKTRRPQREVHSVEFQAQKSGASEAETMVSKDLQWPKHLAVKGLCYYVPLKGKHVPRRFSVYSILGPCLIRLARKEKGKRDSTRVDDKRELQLLQGVDARFEAGKMTALMGTSGAGKTTLLDVIAGYKTGGTIDGQVLIDGQPQEKDIWKKICGYAEQMDVLNPYLSALETIRFTAACRLPGDIDREAVVQEVVRLMSLEEWTDMVIGREAEGEGLPKHVRKRLTIALQLVCQPKILFLDEPTTGLGTVDANLVIQAIRRCTDHMGLITVATIHQPSKVIWDSFDSLLLLVKGGNLAYMGPMGENSEIVLDYFFKLSGKQAPSHVNPADYVLSAVGKVPVERAVIAFQESLISEDLAKGIESDGEGGTETYKESVDKIRLEATKGKSAFKEIGLLAKRHLFTQWRNPSYSLMRLIASIFVSLYMGILFISDKSELTGAVFSIGAIFFLVFVLVIPMQASVVPCIEDRAVLYREATSGLYSRFSYGIGQLLADVLFHILNALLMFVCFYFLVDFKREGAEMGYFILMLFLANWAVMSLGQLFAFASPNEESASGLAGLSVILSVILMGFLIVYEQMPSFWRWGYWVNLFHYIIQGLVTNELSDTVYTLELISATDDTLRGVNATHAFFFGREADLSAGSNAMQASSFMNIALQAAPGRNTFLNESGIVVLASWIQCMVTNECLVDPIAENFLKCNIVPIPRPPCGDEFQRVTDTIDFREINNCLNVDANSTSLEDTLTNEVVQRLSDNERLEVVLCILKALLPPGTGEIVRIILGILKKLFNIVMFVLEISENGLSISIPAELILFVFGWAELEDGEFDAPWKWFYCIMAVGVFIVGIEIFKLVAVSFVVWTKR